MNNISTLMRLRMRIADLRGRGIYQGWSNAHCAIFIHIPKTAGSSVSHSLFGKARGNPHASYDIYEIVNPRKFREYFKFTFVRNPWDRLVSTYFFLSQVENDPMAQSWREQVACHYPDFASFVRGWLSLGKIENSFHFRPQHSFICDADLTPRVDFVGRVETLQADFRHVTDRLGIAAKLDWTNRSNHRPYQDYYTDELRGIVAAVYANDIAAFGYSFESYTPRPAVSGEDVPVVLVADR